MWGCQGQSQAQCLGWQASALLDLGDLMGLEASWRLGLPHVSAQQDFGTQDR